MSAALIERLHQKGDAASRATYSPCLSYRYRLSRQWDADLPHALFIMLNPSTATEYQNDPTVERCERRARMLGFGSFEVCNIFAYRATDPKDMRAAADPVGPQNDQHIQAALADADHIICAWGTHGAHLSRGPQVEALLRRSTAKLHHLGLSKEGHPKHPLYISYAQQLIEWS